MNATGPKGNVTRQPNRRPWLTGAALLIAVLFVWRFPLFHVVPLAKAREVQISGAPNAVQVASKFWNEALPLALERAPAAKDFFAAWMQDPAQARRRFGRTFGISSTTLYLVKGSGHVTTVEPDAVVVALDGSDTKVSLAAGLVFGSAVRDATGLLDVSTYANSQDFNELSLQLDALVEAKVIPTLRAQATVGRALSFAGCGELERGENPPAFPIIPLRVEWR